MHGPVNPSDSAFATKLQEDFDKARTNWPLMDHWIFIHNQRMVGTYTQELIVALTDGNRDVTIEIWSADDLWAAIARLPEFQLQELFGSRDGTPLRRRHRGLLDGLEFTPDGEHVLKYAGLFGHAAMRCYFMAVCIGFPIWIGRIFTHDMFKPHELRWLWWLPDMALSWWWFTAGALVLGTCLQFPTWRLAVGLVNLLHQRTKRWARFSDRGQFVQCHAAYVCIGLPVAAFSVYQVTTDTFAQAAAGVCVWIIFLFYLATQQRLRAA